MSTYLLSLMQPAHATMQHTTGDEYTWARDGRLPLRGGVEVKEVTTDPDSCGGRAGESLFKDGLLANLPTHYLDTRHLSENI